jgi:maltokinase
MLLVDRVTEIVGQSYETDRALLDELRAAWPPTGLSADRTDGYRPIARGDLVPAGAVRLTSDLAVALAMEPGAPDGPFVVVPLARGADGWRRAGPGDGLSAFAAGAPAASERAVGVDQTHESIVVGERIVLKWYRRVGPEPSRATLLLDHLAEVGYPGIPTPLGSLAWRSPSSVTLTLAQGDAFLSGARDGWEWCVERAESGDVAVGARLGKLVRGLHGSLALPSSVLPEPLAMAADGDAGRWRRAAIATLVEAVELTDEPDLRSWAPPMRAAVEAIGDDRDVATQPVHGDLHVGQVLEWSGGLAVIDFDGNPTLPDEANAIAQPRERDVAQMLSSLDHVGRVVEHRGGDASSWIAGVRAGFLEAVGPVDPTLLTAFEVEQECRELVYAARFLPRWRYAPIATLRARFGG